MADFIKVMLVFHFLGLAMGLGASLANLTMMGLLAKATPQEKPILMRFPPAMSRVGETGLALLIASGLALTFTKYSGFGDMAWTFHVKLTFVALIIVVVGLMHMLRAKAARGDAAAAARMPLLGRIGFTCAILAVIFAVLTFN